VGVGWGYEFLDRVLFLSYYKKFDRRRYDAPFFLIRGIDLGFSAKKSPNPNFSD